MAVRATYSAQYTPGSVQEAAISVFQAVGVVAYAQITTTPSATNFSSTPAGITGLQVAITAKANRFYSITVGAAGFTLGGNLGTWEMCAWDDTGAACLASTIVVPQPMANVIVNTATTGSGLPVTFPGRQVSGLHQPSAGTQDYSFVLIGDDGTLAPTASGSGDSPRTAWIIVEEVGPTF